MWERLFSSYGDVGILMQNKLGYMAKMGGLSKVKERENLMHGIYGLKELSKLAGK